MPRIEVSLTDTAPVGRKRLQPHCVSSCLVARICRPAAVGRDGAAVSGLSREIVLLRGFPWDHVEDRMRSRRFPSASETASATRRPSYLRHSGYRSDAQGYLSSPDSSHASAARRRRSTRAADRRCSSCVPVHRSGHRNGRRPARSERSATQVSGPSRPHYRASNAIRGPAIRSSRKRMPASSHALLERDEVGHSLYGSALANDPSFEKMEDVGMFERNSVVEQVRGNDPLSERGNPARHEKPAGDPSSFSRFDDSSQQFDRVARPADMTEKLRADFQELIENLIGNGTSLLIADRLQLSRECVQAMVPQRARAPEAVAEMEFCRGHVHIPLGLTLL